LLAAEESKLALLESGVVGTHVLRMMQDAKGQATADPGMSGNEHPIDGP
jgi:hypothetical protein